MSEDEFDVEIDPTDPLTAQIMPPPREADPDEEPPDPEGHALTPEVVAALGNSEYFHGPIPPDLAALWGHPPARVADEVTCRMLIAAWGVDVFRGSALHQASLRAHARAANLDDVRTQFKTEQKEKGKK